MPISEQNVTGTPQYIPDSWIQPIADFEICADQKIIADPGYIFTIAAMNQFDTFRIATQAYSGITIDETDFNTTPDPNSTDILFVKAAVGFDVYDMSVGATGATGAAGADAIIGTVALGFVHEDATAPAMAINDALIATLITSNATNVIDWQLDGGMIHCTTGWELHDRIFETKLTAASSNAGITCLTDSVMALRCRGTLANVRCPLFRVVGLTIVGGWQNATFTQGTQPYTGIPNEATWVYASPLEALYCERVEFIGNTITYSQYDLISLPRAIGSALIINNHGMYSADDGFNPGGDLGPDVDDDTKNVRNVYSSGNLYEYVYNTGFHLSGGCKNVVSVNDTVNRCGLNAGDFQHYNITMTGFVGTNIGQANASDPAYANYPGDSGNVDGFHRAHTGGETAASGITGQSSYAKSNVHIEAVITGLFDRTGDEQSGLNLSQGSAAVDDCSFKVKLNNSAVDVTYYSNAAVKTAHTGSANNTRFTDTNIEVEGVFVTGNRGGRTDIHHQGRTNTTKVTTEYAVSSNGVGTQCDGDYSNIDIYCKSGGYISLVGDYMEGKAEYYNADPHVSTERNGIFASGSNNNLEKLTLTDARIGSSTGLNNQINHYYYIGAAFQAPGIINNVSNTTSLRWRIGHLHVAQEAVDGTVTAKDLILSRAGLIIEKLSGYSKMTSRWFYKPDHADANIRLETGNIELHHQVWFESVAGTSVYLGDVYIDSHNSASTGTEFTMKTIGTCVNGATIYRQNSYTTKVFTLSGNTSIIRANLINKGTGGLLVDTSTGSVNSLLEP